MMKLLVTWLIMSVSISAFANRFCTPISGQVRKVSFPSCERDYLCVGNYKCNPPNKPSYKLLDQIVLKTPDNSTYGTCKHGNQGIISHAYDHCDRMRHAIKNCNLDQFEAVLAIYKKSDSRENLQSCSNRNGKTVRIFDEFLEEYIGVISKEATHPKYTECRQIFLKFVHEQRFYDARIFSASTSQYNCTVDFGKILSYDDTFTNHVSEKRYIQMIEDYLSNATSFPPNAYYPFPFNPNDRNVRSSCHDEPMSAITGHINNRHVLCEVLRMSPDASGFDIDLEGKYGRGPSLLVSAILAQARPNVIGTLLAEGVDLNTTAWGKTVEEIVMNGHGGYPPRPRLMKMIKEFKNTGKCFDCRTCKEVREIRESQAIKK